MKLYDFQANPGTLFDDVFKVTPIENGAPPAGEFAGIENTQAGQLGDQLLTTEQCIVGVDVIEPPAPRRSRAPTCCCWRNMPTTTARC